MRPLVNHWSPLTHTSLCMVTSRPAAAERQHLRSASRHLFVVPRFQLDTYGCRTFTVAGPTTWNLFQNNLREPDIQIGCFRRTLKTCLFDQYPAHWALFATIRYINWHLHLHTDKSKSKHSRASQGIFTPYAFSATMQFWYMISFTQTSKIRIAHLVWLADFFVKMIW